MASTIDAHEAREVSHSRSRVWGVPFGAETTQLLPPGRVDAGRFQCGWIPAWERRSPPERPKLNGKPEHPPSDGEPDGEAGHRQSSKYLA